MSAIYTTEGYFTTTLSSDINTSTTTIPLTAVPARVTAGYMVIEPESPTKREVIHFTSVGVSSVTSADDTTDASDASGRGCIGSIAVGANITHDQGATVIIASVEQYWSRIRTNIGNVLNLSTGVPKFTVGSDATGDTFYRPSGGDLARLAIGSTSQFLKVVAGLPAWAFAYSNVKVGTTTYDISTTGALAVTGVGFTPKLLILLAQLGSGTNSTLSIGFCTADAVGSISQDDAGKGWPETTKIGTVWITAPGTNSLLAYASFDADGFTLTKSKNGSPTGTATLFYACLG